VYGEHRRASNIYALCCYFSVIRLPRHEYFWKFNLYYLALRDASILQAGTRLRQKSQKSSDRKFCCAVWLGVLLGCRAKAVHSAAMHTEFGNFHPTKLQLNLRNAFKGP
jgi:hypothetical protein